MQFLCCVSLQQVAIILSVDTPLNKIHGSELQGQERAKQITKNKTRDKLLCVFYTSECFRNMTS